MTAAYHAALSCLLNDRLPGAAVTVACALEDPHQGPSQTLLACLLPLLKDFEALYTRFQSHLAHRICFPLQASNDDSSLHSVIDAICGLPACSPERASHLKKMVKDAVDERAVVSQSLTVQMLTQHSWPQSFEPVIEGEFEWKDQVKDSLAVFEREYTARHDGRKVAWCWQLFSVEVEDTLTGQRYLMKPHQLERFTGQLEAVNTGQLISLIEDIKDSQDPQVTEEKGDASSIQSPTTTTANHPILLQSLLAGLLKRRHRLSPAELLKLAKTSAGALKHGNAFVAEGEAVRVAMEALVEKGFAEFNKQDNVYIYLA